VELTRARLLEFLREPEAVFWVFIFPVLLAVALGIAFRTKPVEKLRVAVVRTDPAVERLAALLIGTADLTVSVVASAEATRHCGPAKLTWSWERLARERPAASSVTYR